VLYREYQDQPTREAVAVIRARRLALIENENKDTLTGRIEDFFPLMGDLDNIQPDPESENLYVLCIYNEGEKPFDHPDRITGVTFLEGLSFIRDQQGKRTYHSTFQATRA
jgi:hypothetical protein